MAFRRRFVAAVVLLVMPLAATGCFDVGEVAVENRTNGDITFWTTQVDCDFQGFQSSGRTDQLQITLEPGEMEAIAIFETDLFDFDRCIAIAGPEFTVVGNRRVGNVLTYEVERGTLYAITGQWPAVQIREAGAYDEEIDFSFRVSKTVVLIFGLPFLAGAIAAVIFTIKFFVDWGKRPRTGWS